MEKFIVKVNGKEYEVEVEKVGGSANVSTQAAPAFQAQPAVQTQPVQAAPVTQTAPQEPASQAGSGTPIEAGAAGKVFKIVKRVGDKVERGEQVIILEAMKMEIPMVSTVDGTVESIVVKEGDPVEAGALLATIK